MVVKKAVLILGILCSLFYNLCFADVAWKKYDYFLNTGGLNDNLSTTEIADNESTDLQNVIFDTGGTIKKRFGYRNIPTDATKITTSAAAITGLSFYKTNDGNRFLLATVNTTTGQCLVFKKTYDVGGGLPSGAWDDITNSSVLPTNYSDDKLVTFSTAENNLILTIPATSAIKPLQYTASGNIVTLTSDADCPTASLNCFSKNILFLAGNTTYPSRVYFSAVGDITNYTNTDFFDVGTSDGTKIRALVPAYNAIYIFKDRSIWVLTGDNRDNFVLAKMVEGVGTLSQQSVTMVNNFIYFVTNQNDIAIYDGAYTIKFLSQKIRSTIGGLNFTRATQALGLSFSTYKYADADYYCSVSNAGSGTNNRVLFYDSAYGAWSKFAGLNANAWCVADNPSGQNMMVFGDYNGYVYNYPSTSYYDGDVSNTAISAHYQTKWFRYPEMALGDKIWRLSKIYALTETNASNLYVDFRADYENTGKTVTIPLTITAALWDSAQWDTDLWAGVVLTISRQEIEKGYNMFQLYFYNNTVNEGFTIVGWENFLEPTSRI